MSSLQKTLIILFGILIILTSLGIGGYLAYQQGWIDLGALNLSTTKPSSDTGTQPTKVKITNIGPDRFTVSWLTTQATAGTVVYGTSSTMDKTQLDDRDQASGEAKASKLHHVTVSKLKPSTEYAFKIQSGESKKLYDQDGKPYTVKTAASLGPQPPTDMISGTVKSDSPVEGTLVYIELPGANALSTQVKKDGTWLFNIANALTRDLDDYLDYDPKTTEFTLVIQGETQQSRITTNTANDSPVPEITLGDNQNFAIGGETDSQAKTKTTSKLSADDTTQSTPQTPEVFLQDTVSTPNAEVQILNPSQDYENLYTTTPEFLGTGPVNKVLTIRIAAVTEITGNAIVDSDGNWSYTPKNPLTPATYTLQIDYVNSQGLEETVQKRFVIVATGSGGTDTSIPAFEATPSATVVPTATPVPTPEPTTRVSMPSTDSGVPTSGSSLPTQIVLVLGLLLLAGGGYVKIANRK